MMMRSEENKNQKSPLPLQPHPWLVICPSGKTQTFFSISEDRCYERSIHELGNTTIRASAQEWLVLEDFDSTDCYLWNPISNDKIQLPPLPYNHKLLCLLSAPPNDPQCRVLFLIHETTPPDDDEDENSNDDTSILLRLDVDDSSGTISTTPMTNQPPYDYFTEHLDMPHFENYLIQSEDELLYVYILFYGRKLEDVYKIIVFRFDFVNQVWEEVKSIGETAIFLGPYSGGTTCCTRGTNLKKESIYFTKGRYLYNFNLETQSISVSLPCPHISMTNPHSYWLTHMAAK
ncbi:hypothetical protein H5410_044640 [Solanum commersonii]|uniref:KIB1-4 beta-propeller domain-containing protein n=1 Tax=Solanum commersonii TaxID=4109 RepID=A0A9J5XAA9_SOLCO|nr:hypothetical protein H5410_044640 [Solanum commersonii]